MKLPGPSGAWPWEKINPARGRCQAMTFSLDHIQSDLSIASCGYEKSLIMTTTTTPGMVNIMDILYPDRPRPNPSPAQVIGGWALYDLEVVCRRHSFEWWVDIGALLRQQQDKPA